jgi:hypothetical protein
MPGIKPGMTTERSSPIKIVIAGLGLSIVMPALVAGIHAFLC